MPWWESLEAKFIIFFSYYYSIYLYFLYPYYYFYYYFYSYYYSLPARKKLLDFMLVDFRLPPPPDLNHDHPRQVFPAGPQPRPSMPNIPCRTSSAKIHAKCFLPDLNRENSRAVFPAGPQPRESTASVSCRTSTAGENAKK